ncbi:MAG TPA: hypothetical protein VIE43_06645 [Thermoanaerobaculia bacterium]|jgi:hypothetical protein|nr:hypothetical protein [Thermoanaerobaculia bacterium]
MLKSILVVCVLALAMTTSGCEEKGCAEDKVRAQLFELSSHATQWSDAVRLAELTPWIQLSGPVGELQRLRSALTQDVEECLAPAFSLERQAENEVVEGFLMEMQARSGGLLIGPYYKRAAELRANEQDSVRLVRLRYWPEEVKREDAEKAADLSRKQAALDKAEALKKEEQRVADEAAARASAADLEARLASAAAEAAAQAEREKAAALAQEQRLTANQEQRKAYNEQQLQKAQAREVAKARADAEWKTWLARNREALPVLMKSLDAVLLGLSYDTAPTAPQACADLYAAYSEYVSKVASIPPPPADGPAKRMDSWIRVAADECRQGKIVSSRHYLASGYEQAGLLAKFLSQQP